MMDALSSWLVVLVGSGRSRDSSTNSARSFSRRILAASLHFSLSFLTTMVLCTCLRCSQTLDGLLEGSGPGRSSRHCCNSPSARLNRTRARAHTSANWSGWRRAGARMRLAAPEAAMLTLMSELDTLAASCVQFAQVGRCWLTACGFGPARSVCGISAGRQARASAARACRHRARLRRKPRAQRASLAGSALKPRVQSAPVN